jgi:hypothetical protein
MGFHPSNPANEEEQEFLVTPNGDTPTLESDLRYSMMLAQKFSQLQEASDKLQRLVITISGQKDTIKTL